MCSVNTATLWLRKPTTERTAVARDCSGRHLSPRQWTLHWGIPLAVLLRLPAFSAANQRTITIELLAAASILRLYCFVLVSTSWTTQLSWFFSHMKSPQERETDQGIAEVRTDMAAMSFACAADGEPRKASIIRWLFQNETALLAAFPRATGVLGDFQLLASYSNTNSCESLNRRIKPVVPEKRASTLLDVVSALSEFDDAKMASMNNSGRVVPRGESQRTRMGRTAGRRRRSNAVSAADQPPKPPQRGGRQSTGTHSTAAFSGRLPPLSTPPVGSGQGSNGLAGAPATATIGDRATMLVASLIAEFQAL